ncbi:hypothetical protein J4Q44_G00211630 [Coregonus suidteri]|uniref:Uncharacterized protein n=1 Tax=Coregonus suidteri TaxID=861788 RepID=A0AAN8L977_9TELE
MDKSMWTPARRTSHSKIMGINMELVPFFAAITASTLLGRLFTRCWNIAAGTCFHSATRALVRSGTDVGRLGLAYSRRSNSSQRCSMGLRSGLCAGQASSSTLISTNHSVWTSLCAQGHCHAETGKGLPQTVATKLEAQNLLEDFPSLELRGLDQTMKNSP